MGGDGGEDLYRLAVDQVADIVEIGLIRQGKARDGNNGAGIDAGGPFHGR